MATDYEDDPFVGREFGSCRVESKLAVGGYGMVYKATDTNLGIPRAVKFFHPHLSTEKGFRERFYNEMQLLAQMDHPNIVKIVFSIDEPDISGFVMEFVPGRDLADMLDEEGQLAVDRARDIFTQIVSAIDYAHHSMDPPVIHRDLSPDNAMIRPDGTVKIMDFGISKTISSERLTQTGIVLGKPMYMAPEQFEGQVTISCDQYALGIILYEMLVGDVPFEGETPIAQYRARFRQQVQFPAGLASSIPKDLMDAVLRATQREPNDRFPSVREMLASIDRGGGGGTGRAATPAVAIPAPKIDTASGDDVEGALEEVRVKMEIRKYREALLDLDRVLASHPDHDGARRLRDDCRREMELREARRAVEQAHRQAKAHWQQGNTEAAREELEVFFACLEKLPRSRILEKARKELNKTMPDLVAEVEGLEKERKAAVKELLREARHLYKDREHEEAISALEELLEYEPGHAEAEQLLKHCRQGARRGEIADRLREGIECLRGEEFERAVATFDAVLEIDPDHPEAGRYRDLAQAQLDEQLEEAQRASARQSEIATFLEEGKRHFKNWEYPDAIRCFRMVLSMDDGHEEARQLHDETTARMEDADQLEEIGFLYNEGLSFYQNQQFREAIQCFDRVLKHFQQHKGAVKYRELAESALQSEERVSGLNKDGIAAYRAQQYAQALAAFQAVLKIDRRNRIARKYATLCREMVQVQND